MDRLKNHVRISDINVEWLRVKRAKSGLKSQNEVITFLIRFYLKTKKEKRIQSLNKNSNEEEE